mgnify:CR=1 FL=1|jgi:hypothetical protein
MIEWYCAPSHLSSEKPSFSGIFWSHEGFTVRRPKATRYNPAKSVLSNIAQPPFSEATQPRSDRRRP